METTAIKETDPADHHDFKGKTTRGAFASLTGQVLNFVLRIGSMMALARLLSPRDFGLVGMATAVTGFLILFQDAGLSTAAVQIPSISRAQISMLFWINLAVGGLLFLFCAGTAPLLASFFKEPRVQGLTLVIASGFLFNGAAAQHRVKVHFVGISSDWLFPAADVRCACERFRRAGVDAQYSELESAHGHDAFLADAHLITAQLNEVLHGDEFRRFVAAIAGHDCAAD